MREEEIQIKEEIVSMKGKRFLREKIAKVDRRKTQE
jgi:hypothetical protein